VIGVAIEPKGKADEAKLAGTLAKIALEDPSFKVKTDPDTGQTIIAGMGELHLEIIVDRLVREFKVGVNVGNRLPIRRLSPRAPRPRRNSNIPLPAANRSMAMWYWPWSPFPPARASCSKVVSRPN